jgi:hypothetical protein
MRGVRNPEQVSFSSTNQLQASTGIHLQDGLSGRDAGWNQGEAEIDIINLALKITVLGGVEFNIGELFEKPGLDGRPDLLNAALKQKNSFHSMFFPSTPTMKRPRTSNEYAIEYRPAGNFCSQF